jgi:hypothetical protein
MIRIQYRGRLGNNMIQFAAGYILAKKTGLTLSSGRPRPFIDTFQIQPVSGKSYSNTIVLNNITYYQYLNNPLEDTGYQLKGFFQDGRILCDYRSDILDLYQYKTKPKIDISQDDAFFACRFGDCLKNGRTYCSIEYIEEELKINRHNYRNVYVTSDSPDYPPLVKLMDEYNLNRYNNDPLKTILFAKNFDNLILSAGSFSYWMAYLSEANNITVYGKCRADALQRNNAWGYNKNVKFSL